MTPDVPPKTAFIRCGTKTYAFAIRYAVNGKPYLAITAQNAPLARHIPPKTTHDKTTFYIFPEHTTKFGAVVNRMLDSLEQASQGRAAPQ